MSSVEQRNLKVRQLMGELLAKAAKQDYQLEPPLIWKLNQVCSTKSWGFREILLVIGIAKILDPSYSPTTAFYKCNPRAIYEGPIRDMLFEAGIPRRKSGPLNIAKAAVGIDNAWAGQRRPQDVAQVTVELAEWIEKSNESEIRGCIAALLSNLLGEAKRVEAFNIEVPRESDIAELSKLCWQLIDTMPDAGNTPQFIIGQLLETYHEYANSRIEVIGHKEGASVTSTTSKKPGDIIEQKTNGEILAVYEVTMKPFDEQRASDSEEAVRAFIKLTGQSIAEVVVICRDIDIHPSATQPEDTSIYLGKLAFRGLTYQFFEIHHWIEAALGRLSVEGRIEFYKALNDYIAKPATSERVKEFWKKIHEKDF
jgi:hypothetical protein